MAFNDRVPVPLDPDADPNLPIADSSQPHDIPTGIAPSLAKLQDWTAWVRQYAVLYLSPGSGTIANNIIISGDLDVTGALDVAGAVNFGSSLAVGTTITGASVNVSGALAAGTSISGGTLAVTGGASVGTNLVATGFLSGSYVNITGTPPASNVDPGANRAHATSLIRCSGTITTDAIGGSSVDEGLNIASVSVSSSAIRVTFARAFANNDYTPIAVSGNGGDEFCVVDRSTSTTAYVDIKMRSVSGGAVNPSTIACTFYLQVTGRQ